MRNRFTIQHPGGQSAVALTILLASLGGSLRAEAD